MTLDVAESLIACGNVDQDDLARRFAASYRWSRGYGPGAAKLLRRIERGENWRSANRAIYPEGSFGNGAAMRSAVMGLYFAAEPAKLATASEQVAEITHAHPLAIEGALLVAEATRCAAMGDSVTKIVELRRASSKLAPFQQRLEIAAAWLAGGKVPAAKEIRRSLGNRVTAAESCMTAIYLALAHLERPFLEMQQLAIAVGGDVDTISAMAGAIWGAANGSKKLPEDSHAKLESREEIHAIAIRLHQLATGR